MRHHSPSAKHYTIRSLLAPPKWEEITTQWDFVDSPLWGAVAGLTGAASSLPDVPAPLPAVGAGGRPAERLGSAGRGGTDAGRGGPQPVFQRCPLHRGEKNGRGSDQAGQGDEARGGGRPPGSATAAWPHRLIGVGRKSGACLPDCKTIALSCLRFCMGAPVPLPRPTPAPSPTVGRSRSSYNWPQP